MDLYKLSFNNIRRRKLRSSLTMLGIIIGAAMLMTLLGLTAGVTTAIEDETNAYMYDIVITPASSSGSYLMDNKTVSKIRNQSDLYDFREVTQFSEDVNGTELYVEGVNNWKDVKLIKGTQGVVINKEAVEKLGYDVGSVITVKGNELTVTGIVKKTQVPYIYLNQDTVREMAGDKVGAIYARTNGDPETVSDEVEKNIDGISAVTKSEHVSEIQEMTGQALLFMGIIASIALLVGIISVINTMLISVMERTKELGVLKAIGFTNWEIKGSILFESGLLGFLGGFIGVILGLIGIVIIANLLQLGDYIPGMMPLWLILGVIGGSTLLSILAGLYPAMRASKLNVVEALRNE
ncbi:ABC transporter permease [Methanobacterium petrolearium]|uniref:ABC transporter permease n=1 Tax=Methanobacterium petrolearium TaxID=710190 RepID=UPI001AEA2DE3|nr:FtsX-like permease family protein [Methanobacterium petrolearium]MBP1946532.1 putative ABC transport system permease protein [Methanobacterium petrolearium]BDZ69877.1 ABC transporter permease [Methanobacterium petrolearium]